MKKVREPLHANFNIFSNQTHFHTYLLYSCEISPHLKLSVYGFNDSF